MPDNIRLEDLLSFFPEVELPLEVTEDLVITAETVNKVLPSSIIEAYIVNGKAMNNLTSLQSLYQFLKLLKQKSSMLLFIGKED